MDDATRAQLQPDASTSDDTVDTVAKFHKLTGALAQAEALVTAIAQQRAECAAQLHNDGLSFDEIAAALTLPDRQMSRSRAQQLVERGRGPVGMLWWVLVGPAWQARAWMAEHRATPRSQIVCITRDGEADRALSIEGHVTVVELPGWREAFPGPAGDELLAMLATRNRG